MITNIIPIEPIEAVAREIMNDLCGRNDWAAPINTQIPSKMFGLAAITVDYYTGSELEVVGRNPVTGDLLVHADGYREERAHVNQVEFDAERILARAA